MGRPDESSARDKAVIPEFLPQHHLDLLATRLDVVYDPDLYGNRPRLLAEVADARAILIRNRTIVDQEFLDAAPMLDVVGRLGVGLDNIDMAAAESAGVSVFPAYGGNAISVAEYVIGAVLHLQRRVFEMTPSMVAGEWPRQGHAFGHELAGKTLGLVGFGAIARLVAVRAAAFGMSIIAHDPHIDPDDPRWGAVESVAMADILQRADVISLHVPFNEQTANLISVNEIALMKDGALLINTARGGIVDEAAVAEALRSGRLGGAALDVFAKEPLGRDVGALFAGIENLILTPHLAGNTAESVERVASMTVEAVMKAVD